jgi:hypothetical protein
MASPHHLLDPDRLSPPDRLLRGEADGHGEAGGGAVIQRSAIMPDAFEKVLEFRPDAAINPPELSTKFAASPSSAIFMT